MIFAWNPYSGKNHDGSCDPQNYSAKVIIHVKGFSTIKNHVKGL